MRLTWLGHSAFRLDYAGKAVLIDPFFTGNPAFSADRAEVTRGLTHILVTHGHSDHVGDTVALAKETGATVVTNFELCGWLGSQGVETVNPLNLGGTVDAGGFTVTMVRADHSASLADLGAMQPVGPAAGLILKAAGEKTVYHLGDTDIFSDMALIAEIHRPDIALVPIGDRFTMGPEVAALAVRRFLKTRTVIPAHYATFPLLVDSATLFVKGLEGSGSDVAVLENGRTAEF